MFSLKTFPVQNCPDLDIKYLNKILRMGLDNSDVGFQEQLTAGPGVGQRAEKLTVKSEPVNDEQAITYYNKCDNMLLPIPDRVLCDV